MTVGVRVVEGKNPADTVVETLGTTEGEIEAELTLLLLGASDDDTVAEGDAGGCSQNRGPAITTTTAEQNEIDATS